MERRGEKERDSAVNVLAAKLIGTDAPRPGCLLVAVVQTTSAAGFSRGQIVMAAPLAGLISETRNKICRKAKKAKIKY